MRHRAPVHFLIGIVAVIVMCVPASTADAQVANPQATLSQYVADLLKNPADDALRERIIKLAAGMNPAPEIPETAREHYVMAVTFVESAKDAGGYGRAIKEYEAALSVAPWWADAYKKLAIAAKAAGRYDEGIKALGMYLASQPSDARDAQDEIYKLKALKQTASAAAAAAAAAPAPPPLSPFEALLKRIDGKRYVMPADGDVQTIDVKGRTLVCGMVDGTSNQRGYREFERIEIVGPETTVMGTRLSWQTVWAVSRTFIIAVDGESITIRTRFSDGDSRVYVFTGGR